MDKKSELCLQIKIVIDYIENNYQSEMKQGVISTILSRYKNALQILKDDKNKDQLNIAGGVMAYLDSYSDYENPLLKEMHQAEELAEKL
ncbi:hypothetical protein [Gracilibacillus saliphilus]|uniref:hypothetical protein n=1 Tax=Gracilibacillus saliphilus TaxID=543890 RepID=UPI0013D64352|nr:hypothetical protein [Gracilibacillus saliphilus]